MSPNSGENHYFKTTGLAKSFDGREILRGVDAEIPREKATVILGGSGAGKSVYLKHLNGLLRPDCGSVSIKGTSIDEFSEDRLSEYRRKIGFLFQHGALFDSLSVGENVAFPLVESRSCSHSEIELRVEESLSKVGLSGEQEKMPAALSGGMRKRVALARAIVARPECILYDEPTAGLDPVLARSIIALIRSLQEDLQLTTVVVTHNMGAVREIADHLIFIDQGHALFSGSWDEFQTSAEPRIQQFLEAGTDYSD